MSKKIMVFDDYKESFRKLNPNNYNDDLIIGSVFFERRALEVIKKTFGICGYMIIGKDNEMYPIDIHDTEIAMLEGTYNCLPENIKEELIEYNIQYKPEIIWSEFFFLWKFICNWDVFEKSGSFIQLCTNIIGNVEKCNLIEQEKIVLVFPTSYIELCDLAKNIQRVTQVDFYDSRYVEDFNYILDSLIKGYRINMTESEIDIYCYQICTLVNNKWED